MTADAHSLAAAEAALRDWHITARDVTDRAVAAEEVIANVRALADQWSAEFRREFPNVGPQFTDARADALRALLPESPA